jgi:hypothetical protein
MVYVFFDIIPQPMVIRELERWEFFELPRGANAATFRGRLIGESSDLRAERLGRSQKVGELS